MPFIVQPLSKGIVTARFDHILNNDTRGELLARRARYEQGGLIGDRPGGGPGAQLNSSQSSYMQNCWFNRDKTSGFWPADPVEEIVTEATAQLVERMLSDVDGKERVASDCRRVDSYWAQGASDHFQVWIAESRSQITVHFATPPTPDSPEEYEAYRKRRDGLKDPGEAYVELDPDSKRNRVWIVCSRLFYNRLPQIAKETAEPVPPFRPCPEVIVYRVLVK